MKLGASIVFMATKNHQHVSKGQWLIAILVTKPQCTQGMIFSGWLTQLNNENRLRFKLDRNAPGELLCITCVVFLMVMTLAAFCPPEQKPKDWTWDLMDVKSSTMTSSSVHQEMTNVQLNVWCKSRWSGGTGRVVLFNVAVVSLRNTLYDLPKMRLRGQNTFNYTFCHPLSPRALFIQPSCYFI